MTPEQRFKDSFGRTVQWGIGKEVTIRSFKEKAFNEANYLMFPRNRRKYLVVDVDYEFAMFSWEDNMLPRPTIICSNPINGHAHLLWELKKAVFWNPLISAKNRPKKYFSSLQKAFEKKVGGDNGYTHASTKNPFSPMWKTYWADVTYNLDDLSEYIVARRNDFWNEKAAEAFAGRNDELFYFTRKYSYRVLSKATSRDDLERIIKEYCAYYNEKEIPTNWPFRGKLGQSEINSICRGVAKWSWMNREHPSMKQRMKNIGVMKLEPIGQIEGKEAASAIIQSRQALGAKYVNDMRTDSTRDAITLSINLLQHDCIKVTLRNISELTGLSYRTVNRYKNYVRTLINII